MNGLYLYCVRKSNFPPFKVDKTIGEGKVLLISQGGLEAVVSQVDLKKFQGEEIQKKAQEDLKWIKEKAQIHEHVIERAMKKGNEGVITVIPMKFGIIFRTKEKLLKSLKEHSQQFLESLEKLEGKQEWEIKVYLKEGIFDKYLEEKSEIMQQKKKEIESMPQGLAFFAQKKLTDSLSCVREEGLEKITREMFEDLKNLAEFSNKAKNLEKEMTGRLEPMVLNAYFLIKEDKIFQFKKAIGDLEKKYNSLGFLITYVGPWPPYHFA